jgi:hypothetical protein
LHAAPHGHLVGVAEQPEAGHVGDGARLEGPQRVGRIRVERRHPPDCLRERLIVGEPALVAVEDESCPERLRQEERVPGPGTGLRPDRVGPHGADDGEAVLRLVVPQRVPAGEDRAGSADLLVGAVEDRAHDAELELLREASDREREQRRAAHREHVVERVRRRDPPERMRVVDERREEVEREDDRAVVVEAVDGRVVGGIEADEQVLGVGRDEPAQELLEPRGGVLRGAPAGGDERGQLHAVEHRAAAATAAAASQGRGGASKPFLGSSPAELRGSA